MGGCLFFWGRGVKKFFSCPFPFPVVSYKQKILPDPAESAGGRGLVRRARQKRITGEERYGMEKSVHLDHLTLGVCYYPEHWEERLWQDDLRRMKESGIVISINTDPDAPINQLADYVITGSVEEVVPKLIKYYKQNSK